ncbi:16779_t:CDS:2 [Racocetra fulgida]|uniref:16779_t:CDS:1 n=1 Tax=Racocetra fulgida TaxID=60492 RepID=A0A9N9D764_9GLOM|nr:16779_t:CDS:2 [Racocetra fulgida]
MTTNATEQLQLNTTSATSTVISSIIFNTAITAGAFITFDLIRKRWVKIFEPKTYLVPERPTLMASDEELILRAGLDGYMFLRVIRLFMILFALFTIVGLCLILPLNHINQRDKRGLESFTIEHRISPRATTILVVGIPDQLNNEEDLKNLFSVFPGGVKRVWLNRLIDLTVKRMKLIHNLEYAETDFLLKYLKHLAKDDESEQDVEDGDKVPIFLRPTHRTIPLIGKKVDSIEMYREEIQKLNEEINELRKKIDSFKKLRSAFVQFNNYVGAQLAATLTIPRLTEITREDVIWENLNLTRIQRLINVLLVTTSANGAFQALPTLLNNPPSIISSLAENLPLASTFFLTYVLLSLTTAGLESLQLGTLAMYLLNKLHVKTPRQILEVETSLTSKDWGITFPPHILMASIETNGVLFLHAMKQFYWGILIFQLTMIGLMSLNQAFIPAEFLPVDLMGIIDIKTRKVIIDTEIFTKSISTVTEEVEYDEKADLGSTSKQVSEKPTDDEYDEYTDPNVVHIKHGELEKDSPNTYTHPALIVNNPIVWIPEDSAKAYVEEVRKCKDHGLNAMSQGATISEKYKIKVDITKAPNIKDELFVESAEITFKNSVKVTD